MEQAEKPAGEYKYRFSTEALGYPNGIYWIRTTFDDKVFVNKVIELK